MRAFVFVGRFWLFLLSWWEVMFWPELFVEVADKVCCSLRNGMVLPLGGISCFVVAFGVASIFP